jgi:hypothetical protein
MAPISTTRVNVAVAAALLVSPLANAIAVIVSEVVVLTVIAELYNVEEEVGMLPSVV